MTTIGFSLTLIETALSRSLIQALWQNALLGFAAALVFALTARRSAATRHVLGLAFLLAMAVLPALEFVHLLSVGGSFAPALLDKAGTAEHMLLSADALSALIPLAAGDTGSPPVWLPWLWACGVAVMAVRLAGGSWLLRSLARQESAPLPPDWTQRLDHLRRALGITRPITIKMLDAINQPFSSRLLRPLIWFPAAMITRLAPEQIEALLAHELAHIRRLDWIWNGLQCAIEALLFFHPAVWWLSRRIRQEREHACDDLAVSVCGDPIVVAEALASLEALRGPLPRLVLAANGGALMQRVRRLLGASRPPRIRWTAAASFAVLTCATGLVAIRSSVASDSPAATAPAAAAAAPSLTPPATTQAIPAATPIARDRWWTYVGDSMRIKTNEDGHTRDYHAWVDLSGKSHETWYVDGQSAAIDDSTRKWVAEHHHEPAPPAPPKPPLAAPPAVPEVTAIAELPPPPPPPDMAEDPAFKALVEALQHDVQAVAMLGSPIIVSADCHPCRIKDDSDSLHLTVHGPKGTALLDAEGTLTNGQWHYPKLQLTSG